MKFSLVSDLHVNHPQPKFPYDLLEELVVVAGDTSNGLDGLRFLNKLRKRGHRVVATDGNHEHYSNRTRDRTAIQTMARFREFCSDLIDYGRHEPVFILRNGWYQVRREQAWFEYMNDGHWGSLSAEQVNGFAQQDAAFVEDCLHQCTVVGRKAVVVTHTAPCDETLDPRFEGALSNEWYVNPAMTPLLSRYRDTIAIWCHGHTHAPADKIVDGVRVVCNPRGYPGENPDWRPLTVEVP